MQINLQCKFKMFANSTKHFALSHWSTNESTAYTYIAPSVVKLLRDVLIILANKSERLYTVA